VDLATASREDHAVVVVVDLLPLSQRSTQNPDGEGQSRARQRCFDADALANPYRRNYFRYRLAALFDAVEAKPSNLEDERSPAGIDKRLRHLNDGVLTLAASFFGTKTATPKK
jgi:hypothetical protein